jgi:hypothetical protein
MYALVSAVTCKNPFTPTSKDVPQNGRDGIAPFDFPKNESPRLDVEKRRGT